MFVTVAICTWNRARSLDQTLSRLAEVDVPKGVGWEVVVVNNNSTDDTAAVLDRHLAAGRLPLRVLVETKQGLSNARNCALTATHGEFIIWTDDDVLVDQRWLVEYVRGFERHPAAAFFGGPVAPWYPDREPDVEMARFVAADGAMFALVHHGEVEGVLEAPKNVVGANMAFRTGVLKAIRFDPALGRIGTGMLGDDEVQILEKIRSDGGHGVWLPRVRVQHYVPPERMTRAFAWRYYCGLGQTEVRRYGVKARRRLFGRPLWAVRQYAGSLATYALRRALGRPGWLKPYTQAAFLSGVMTECRTGGAAE